MPPLLFVDPLPSGIVPMRIRLQRAAGWRKPPNTVKVDRTTMWGNRWTVGTWSNTLGRNVETVEEAVSLYRKLAWPDPHHQAWIRETLEHRNLGCWCKLCDEHRDGKPAGVVCWICSPCHADWLLQVANSNGQPVN